MKCKIIKLFVKLAIVHDLPTKYALQRNNNNITNKTPIDKVIFRVAQINSNWNKFGMKTKYIW